MPVRLEHSSNAELSICVTELGIFMVCKLEHFWNARPPILVTVFGNVTDVRVVIP